MGELGWVGGGIDVDDDIASRGEDHEGIEAPGDETNHDGRAGARDLDQRGPRSEVAKEVSGDRAGSANDDAAAPVCETEIDRAFDVGCEHRKEAVEVTVGAGGDELLGDKPLLGRAHSARSGPFGADSETSPVGKLAASWCRSPEGAGHGLEGESEDVVKHERHPFGRGEVLEDDEQGETNLVIEGYGRAGPAAPSLRAPPHASRPFRAAPPPNSDGGHAPHW